MKSMQCGAPSEQPQQQAPPDSSPACWAGPSAGSFNATTTSLSRDDGKMMPQPEVLYESLLNGLFGFPCELSHTSGCFYWMALSTQRLIDIHG